MLKLIQSYFAFTNVELAAFLLISTLSLSIIGYTFLFEYKEFPDISLIEQRNFMEGEGYYPNIKGKSFEKQKRKLVYVKFDPNNADSLVMLQMGIPPWTIKSIKKYISKGGFFKTKDDLKKVYSLKPDVYQKIEPYINIAEKPVHESFPRYNVAPIVVKKLIIVDLNLADSTQLEELPGIGASFASRIIKYRDLIGGFVKKEQLFEVWGLDSALFYKIEPSIIIDVSSIRTIKVNSIYEADIYHPYLTRKQSRIIFNYQKNHGKYTKPNDLLNTSVIDKAEIEKILPYLAF